MKKKKYLLTVFATIFGFLNLYSQHSKDLIGTQHINTLKGNELYPWFDKGYAAYNTDTALISQLSLLINKGVTITVVAGTWCVDTKRELPKFVKVLDKASYNDNNLKLIFVNTSKTSPEKDEKRLKVKTVPTFIVYMNGKEKGRIREKSTITFEQNLLNILSK